MSAGEERLFLDTVFVQALLNRRDQYHARAREFVPRLRAAAVVWVTEAILVEVGNALGTLNRAGAVAFIEECYRTPNIRVVAVDTALLSRPRGSTAPAATRSGGLTDCISFVVMQDQWLHDAVTTDHHFQQAGFRALLLDEP